MHVRIPNAFNVPPSTLSVNGYRQRIPSTDIFFHLIPVTQPRHAVLSMRRAELRSQDLHAPEIHHIELIPDMHDHT